MGMSDTRFDPPWMALARKELGVYEIPGPKDHPRIVWYHGATAAGEAPDEVAWCSSFLCRMFQEAGIAHPRSKSSHAWKTWGVPIQIAAVGAVAVFDYGNGKGHVTLVAGKTAAGLIVGLGGNQGQRVKMSAYGPQHLVGYRWPDTPVIDLAAAGNESTR